MYQAPEFKKLGSVSAFTLGSSHSGGITYNKATNSTGDTFAGYPGYSPGEPCTTSNGSPC
jgi:hypothetical protein